METTFRWFLVCLLLLVAFAAPLQAQEGSSTITGRVADTTGAVIPGVNISLTSTALMGARDMITDERGVYRFNLLPPGMYALKFELPGFKTLIREEIRLTAGFTATINIDMEVATQAETVTVTGQSPVVDLQSAAVSVNFTQDLLRDIPSGRDLWSTLGQTPGIMMRKFDVGGSQAGQTSGFRTYGTDGQDYTALDGVRYNAAYLDYGAQEEMQVVTASKGADLRTAGTYVNSVVKSGSNDIHGMVYAAVSPSSLQGSNLTDRLKAFGLTSTNRISTFTDTNGNVGGPLKQDRFWWFLSLRDNYIGVKSPGFKKGGCTTAMACTGQPQGTYVNDNPSNEDGSFYTRLDNVTMKLNGQINSKNQFSALGNFADKRQPFRGGNGASAGFFNTDSVARQTYPTLLHKVQVTSVINNHITLDNSLNRMGYHWPNDRRVDEFSRRDLDTLQVRGGFSGEGTGFSLSPPNTRDPAIWHYNTNLSMLTDKFITGSHDMKVGYMWKYVRDKRSINGTIGQVVLYYRGGFRTPQFIETLDAPFSIESSLKEHSVYFNDSWRVTPKLTLNLGFRFDRAMPYYPRQEKTGQGPFQAKQVVERRNLATMNGPVPRVSLIYDVFGNGRTAFKASYGRYTYEAGGATGSDLSTEVNPMTLTVTRYDWDGTLPFSPIGKTPVQVTGGRDRDFDPNLKFPYIEEFTAGVDQELMTDVSLRLNVVRKFDQNKWEFMNTAIPYDAYNIPVNGVDPGRDGIAGNSDDQTRLLYSLQPAFVGRRKDVIRNNNALDNANTALEATLIKRLSNKWQMITGWSYLHRKVWSGALISTDATGIPQDPNNLRFNTGENFNAWTYKIMGTYQAPFGLSVSGVFRGAKGEAYGRRWNSPRLNQGVQALTVEPIGTFFMDTIKLVDFRAEKTFTVSERWGKVGVMVDIFNALNSAAVTGINNLTGSAFQRPTQTVEPRIARVGIRYTY